jgi:hypothetical protein
LTIYLLSWYDIEVERERQKIKFKGEINYG